MFDLNQGLFRPADGTLTRIANALELEPNYRVLYADREGRIWVGQPGQVALYGHRKSQIFGTSDGVPPGRVWTIFHEHAGSIVASGWAVRAVRASSTMTVSARSPNPTDFPLSPSSPWLKTTTVTGGLPPMWSSESSSRRRSPIRWCHVGVACCLVFRAGLG